MQVDILTSNIKHPGLNGIKEYYHDNMAQNGLSLCIFDDVRKLRKNGILFLVSYQNKLNLTEYSDYTNIIVFHASDLPRGRGWSPYIWDILSGADTITVSAISAADEIDCGDIWAKTKFDVAKTDFLAEIMEQISLAQLNLLKEVVTMVGSGMHPIPQDLTTKPTYFSKRTPKDSYLDPEKTLNQLFDQIRMSDPKRFPAVVEIHGEKFKILMERLDDEKHNNR